MNLFKKIDRAVPMITQDSAGECGLACLAMIAVGLGHQIDLPFLRQRYPTTRRGLTFADLARISTDLSLNRRAFAVEEAAELKSVQRPVILHWERNHFVVLIGFRRGKFLIHNPAYGVRSLPIEDVERSFSGAILEFDRSEDFARIVNANRWTLGSVLRRVSGLKTSLLQVIAISSATAILALILPILVQMALDDVVPRKDAGLLAALVAAYFLVSCISTLGEWFKQRIILNTGTAFVAQLTRNAVGHLFRLPLRYFESRHPADIAVRLDSVENIKSVVVQSVVTAVVDGLVIVLAAAMMMIYAPLLGAFIALTLLVVAAIRLLIFPYIRRLGGESLQAKSEERSRLMDHVRAIVPLRIGQAIDRASVRWYGALVKHLNADFRLGRLEANLSAIVQVLVAAGTSLTLYFGVVAVLSNSMTVGMLYAFFTFRTLFFEKLEAVVSSTIQISMLSANMTRLRDFVQETPEPRRTITLIGHGRRPKLLELQHATLRFGHADTAALMDVSTTIDLSSGQTIGIVGTSGSGKTTLLKVLASLYPLTEGEFLIDGQPLLKFGLDRYRANVGLLLGADKLIQGTIAQNVSMMADDADPARVQHCLDLAALWDDVQKLPWDVDTVVSEESSLLSTGQRRRLMLARALYTSPQLLLLDEIASNLDQACAAKIIENLKGVRATKLLSSHSAMTIPGCDRYLQVIGGRLFDQDQSFASSPRQRSAAKGEVPC